MQEVEDGFGHHRRSAEVVLDILGSVMLLLLEIGVARISRARSRSPARRRRAQPTPRMAHPAHTARTHEVGFTTPARNLTA